MSAIRRDAVRVVVPASSANLGPGFDSIGLALSVYDELIAMATDDEGLLVEVVGEGESVVPRDETNLVAHSMLEAFAWMDVPVPGFILRCTNAVPHGRGLGSSASAIIGGIVLAFPVVSMALDAAGRPVFGRSSRIAEARLDTLSVHPLPIPLLLIGFVLSMAILAGNSLNPFLYFRF